MGNISKTFRPSVVNGDVSTVIQSDKTDLPFASGDLLFDWTAVDIPLRTNTIEGGIIHAYGEDGSSQGAGDIMLLIAKTNNGAAPTTLGTVNDPPSSCYELPDVLMQVMKFEASSNTNGKLNLANLGSSYYFYNMSGAAGNSAIHTQSGPLPIEPENNNLGGTSTNRIYVAGVAGGVIDFSTGVLADGAITSDSATSITTQTVDPRKAFRVGDTVYLHDVDTALGTIASMTATNITLNAAIAGGTDIADEDEFINDKPITVTLNFG